MFDRARGWFASTIFLLTTCIGFTVSAHAACYQPDDKLPQNQIETFLNNPTELLADNPTGGGSLESSILKLVGSDNIVLPAVIKLLSSANPQQRAAIGAGLAAAAQLCLASDQIFAGQIQTAIAEKGDRVALEAFITGGGQDTATAAIGAGAPAATAFVSGFAQVTGNSNTNNAPFVLPTGASSSGGSSNLFTFNARFNPKVATTGASTPTSP
jgi:hypothetical protein